MDAIPAFAKQRLLNRRQSFFHRMFLHRRGFAANAGTSRHRGLGRRVGFIAPLRIGRVTGRDAGPPRGRFPSRSRRNRRVLNRRHLCVTKVGRIEPPYVCNGGVRPRGRFSKGDVFGRCQMDFSHRPIEPNPVIGRGRRAV